MALNINQTLTELEETLSQLANCCGEKGKTGGQGSDDSGLGASDAPIGEGEKFPDQPSYISAKCNAANAIYDQLFGVIAWLTNNEADLIAGVFGGITTGLVVQMALGPLGWAMTAVEVIVAGIAGLIIAFNLNFEDIQTALEQVHEETVQGLFAGGTSSASRENFLSALDGATQSLTTAERQIVQYMLPNKLLNELFSPASDTAEYQSPDPVNCGAIQVWTFTSGVEGFTFRDDSNNNGSAEMSHDLSGGALQFGLDMPGGQTHTRAIGVGISPTVSIPVGIGNSVQMDYSGPLENNYQTWKTLRVIFTDATSQSGLNIDGGAGTVVVDIEASKTIQKVEVEPQLYSGSTNWELHETINILEVRII